MVDDRHYCVRVLLVIILGAVYINKADGCSKLSLTDSSGNYYYEGTYTNLGTALSCSSSGRDTWRLSNKYTYYVYYRPSTSHWVLGKSPCSSRGYGILDSTTYTPTGRWQSSSSSKQWVYEGMSIRCSSSSSGSAKAWKIAGSVVGTIVTIVLIVTIRLLTRGNGTLVVPLDLDG